MSKSILLIVSGSIAAVKVPDVVRRLREQNVKVTCVLTQSGAQFVTPLALASLSGNPVYGDLWSLKDEAEMGHIRLSRDHDLIAVLPASANIISSMAVGRADDLATAVLLASNKPIMIAPAMNTQMWHNPATQRNIKQLRADGVEVIAPASGMLACGEQGQGRLAEVDTLVAAILARLGASAPLRGIKALITSGPTHEPVDPVRYIGNRSSGKQGHAIAAALAAAGADVTLVSGPVAEVTPEGVRVVPVQTADEMLTACQKALPVDVAVCAAAVADWKVKKIFTGKLKKRANAEPPSLELVPNPDILKTLSTPGRHRPKLVVGFAAETEQLKKHATEKRLAKGCDWIVANDVSGGKVFGQTHTTAHLITPKGAESFESVSKQQLAAAITERIIQFFIEESSHGKRTDRKAPPRR